MSQQKVPTLYEWVGGIDRIETLFMTFYQRVPDDPILAAVFANMSPQHFRTVAHFVGEVLGGPKLYSGDGIHSHSTMIAKHLSRHLTNRQRMRWMELLLDTADQLNLPDDPEFRSALVGYLEWGSRLAVINSASSVNPIEESAAMPDWGWGEPKGPYIESNQGSAAQNSVDVVSVVSPSISSSVEIVRGRNMTIRFDSSRCIHSRSCVLGAPNVFKANTAGEWIYPDAISPEKLIAVAQNCPSGAIRYERHDGGPGEAAPEVNTIHIRENGPYAIHGELAAALKTEGYRVTLCRCGQSKNKPWCDGSHVSANFVASGEPKSGSIEPLHVRDGELAVTPLRNGPLRIAGSVEICSGTGRPVVRTKEAYLCRCGLSKNKPFCDGSHSKSDFTAEGD